MGVGDWVILASVLLTGAGLLWRITRVEVDMRERLTRLEVGLAAMGPRIERVEARLTVRLDRVDARPAGSSDPVPEHV